MDSWHALFEEISIGNDALERGFAIDGVRFEANRIVSVAGDAHFRITAVRPLLFGEVGHFVTHAADFKYRTFGIHLGQLDRLTFFSRSGPPIKAFLIDCRIGSLSFGRRLAIAFSPSLSRRLTIPCGVAHSFENLENVVTKNDLSLFVADEASGWSLANDDIVFPWTRKGILNAPEVTPNTLPLSLPASLLFYRLQMQLLRGGQQTFGRELLLRVGGAEQRVVVGKHTRAANNVARLMRAVRVQGCGFELNSFGSVAKGSWSVIPGTESCAVDWLVFDVADDAATRFSVFSTDQICLTVLDLGASTVEIELCDFRKNAAVPRKVQSLTLKEDSRVRLRIGSGVGFRICTPGRHLFRLEYLGAAPRLRPGKSRLDRLRQVPA